MNVIKLYTDEDLRNATPPKFVESEKLDIKTRLTIGFFIFCLLIGSLLHKY